MNSKIVSKKLTNVVFLSIILVTGTISLSFSSFFMINVQAQPSYYYDDGMHDNNNYYKSKDSNSKNISLNKLNCINTNININGNNTGDVSIGNKGATEGYSGAYSSGSGEGYYERYSKQDKGFDCVINNNNTNTNIAVGDNQTISEPGPPKTTLNVTKVVTCIDVTTNGLTGISIQQASPLCERLEEVITEDQWLINVTGNNPVPASFDGSDSGTVVTLAAGNYVVTEIPKGSISIDIEDLLDNEFPPNIGIGSDPPTFTGDCTAVSDGFEATGTIAAGESQTCNIENSFTINPGKR